MEAIKVFLTQNIFTSMGGFALSDWMRLLKKHFFEISICYYPRMFFTTLMSLQSTLAKSKDDKLFNEAQVQIPEPVFILGHWRSGTTHLHNLITLDPQWSYPDYISVTQPLGFLTLAKQIRESKVLRFFSPKTRLIDNMAVTLESPMEDEVALALMNQMSPAMGYIFPKRAHEYDRYLTLRDLTTEERAQWQNTFKKFLKKLYLVNPKPVVLKSPPHTARIKTILEVFPKARFVHIHRDPYEVFVSCKRSSLIMLKMLTLQKAEWENYDQRIINQYRDLYKCYFEDLKLIPKGQFTEVSFQDLESNPISTLQKIYQDLGFKDFNRLEPLAKNYLGQLKSFSKISHSTLKPSEIKLINDNWQQSFKAWGYKRRDA